MLDKLVKTHPEFKFKTFMRNSSHIEMVCDLGVEIVQGSSSDIDPISSHACPADITINLGDIDSIVLNGAIITGQRACVVDDSKLPAVLLRMGELAVFIDGGKKGTINVSLYCRNDLHLRGNHL